MNVSALVIDFSRVLIFAHAEVPSLNKLHAKLAESGPGYHVLDHFYLNTELIAYLREFNSRWPIYLFTDGKLHALPEIAPKLEGVFTLIVTAEEIGHKKTEPEAFLGLAYRIGRPPSSLLFVDDQQPNLDAAAEAGLAIHQYTTNAELIKFLKAATV